jgi:hypothetical protein
MISKGNSQLGVTMIGACVFLFQEIECILAFLREIERGILYKKLSHWPSYFREVLNEPPVEIGMTQEATYCLDSSGIR